MGELILNLKQEFKIPLDADLITPDSFAGKGVQEINALDLWAGNKRLSIGNVFDVAGEAGSKAEDLTIIMNGNLNKVKRLGKAMKNGKILVNSSVASFLGEEMCGGTILVNGSAGSFLGIGMKGGSIEVSGDAGDCVGASYRGSRGGMSGGIIHVQGNVGSETGLWMKDGVIKIDGSTGLLAGARMHGGTILISGNSEGRLGASMVGGKVVLLGSVPSILPSFLIDDIRPNTKVEKEKIAGPFYTFIGDIAERGDGKVFVSLEKNPHLRVKEEFIL